MHICMFDKQVTDFTMYTTHQVKWNAGKTDTSIKKTKLYVWQTIEFTKCNQQIAIKKSITVCLTKTLQMLNVHNRQ